MDGIICKLCKIATLYVNCLLSTDYVVLAVAGKSSKVIYLRILLSILGFPYFRLKRPFLAFDSIFCLYQFFLLILHTEMMQRHVSITASMPVLYWNVIWLRLKHFGTACLLFGDDLLVALIILKHNLFSTQVLVPVDMHYFNLFLLLFPA